MILACPRCRRHVQIPDSLGGRQVACPHCGQVFGLPNDLIPIPPSAVVLLSPPPAAQARVTPATGPEIVRVSARILHWPRGCACCLGAATTSRPAVAGRDSGVRVVRTDERSWAVPYCHACTDHAERASTLYGEIHRWRSESDRRHSEASRVSGLSGGAKSLRGWAIGIAVLLILAGTGAALKTVPKGSDEASAVGAAGAVLATLAGLGIYAVFALCAGAAERLRTARERRAAAAAESRVAALTQESERLAGAGCACARDAVEYAGWRGSVHTFVFHNPRYAEAFRAANSGKCLS